MNAPASSPLEIVRKFLDSFVTRESREEKLAKALKELVGLQSIDKMGRLDGPKLNVAAVARKANLPRDLVSHENCELPGARELIVNTLRLLSEYSFEVQCEYLKEEVKHLRMRLDRQDSILANRVVAMYNAKSKVEPTRENKYSAADVRRSARIVPMEEIRK